MSELPEQPLDIKFGVIDFNEVNRSLTEKIRKQRWGAMAKACLAPGICGESGVCDNCKPAPPEVASTFGRGPYAAPEPYEPKPPQSTRCTVCNVWCLKSTRRKTACSGECQRKWLDINVPGNKTLPNEQIPEITKRLEHFHMCGTDACPHPDCVDEIDRRLGGLTMGDGMSDSDAHRDQKREEREARANKAKSLVRLIDKLDQEIAEHDAKVSNKRTERQKLEEELTKLTNGR